MASFSRCVLCSGGTEQHETVLHGPFRSDASRLSYLPPLPSLVFPPGLSVLAPGNSLAPSPPGSRFGER